MWLRVRLPLAHPNNVAIYSMVVNGWEKQTQFGGVLSAAESERGNWIGHSLTHAISITSCDDSSLNRGMSATGIYVYICIARTIKSNVFERLLHAALFLPRPSSVSFSFFGLFFFSFFFVFPFCCWMSVASLVRARGIKINRAISVRER